MIGSLLIDLLLVLLHPLIVLHHILKGLWSERVKLLQGHPFERDWANTSRLALLLHGLVAHTGMNLLGLQVLVVVGAQDVLEHSVDANVFPLVLLVFIKVSRRCCVRPLLAILAACK